MAICMSSIGTPLRSPAAQKVRRSLCGVMCLQPAIVAMRFTMRRASRVVIAFPPRLRRRGPAVRPSTTTRTVRMTGTESGLSAGFPPLPMNFRLS
jgi:hypothetical protein